MEAQVCARCALSKGLGAFMSRRSSHTGPHNRDSVCRQCRSELSRGVPDEIVRLRQQEQRMARRLDALRARIRTLQQGEKVA